LLSITATAPLISYPRPPFPGLLHEAILAGKRPDIDEWAEEEVSGGPVGLKGVVAAYCQLAKQCWHHDPKQRPTFAAAIYPQLTALLQQCP
jgi:hypothetical protein